MTTVFTDALADELEWSNMLKKLSAHLDDFQFIKCEGFLASLSVIKTYNLENYFHYSCSGSNMLFELQAILPLEEKRKTDWDTLFLVVNIDTLVAPKFFGLEKFLPTPWPRELYDKEVRLFAKFLTEVSSECASSVIIRYYEHSFPVNGHVGLKRAARASAKKVLGIK